MSLLPGTKERANKERKEGRGKGEGEKGEEDRGYSLLEGDTGDGDVTAPWDGDSPLGFLDGVLSAVLDQSRLLLLAVELAFVEVTGVKRSLQAQMETYLFI